MTSSELSDVSSLSSAQSIETDDEILNPKPRPGTLDQWLKKSEPSPSPPPKKREPSPPHEYVLADNPHIPFIVMFRARFGESFPRSCPHFGPQDIERGVQGDLPDDGVEKLLCCLLGLVLNRKKDVEKGHYSRALEEAVLSNTQQWPKSWKGNNPLHGGNNFNNMKPEQRLDLLYALILWALNSSETIKKVIKDNYKGNRDKEDLNSGLQVQPWGQDGYKRRYWMIEGREDTHFRIYRESNPALKTNTWWSVADSIPAARELAEKLKEDGTRASKRLHDAIQSAIPRLEAGEEKRKRRDYRIARKQQFVRPAPGFSLYEGRTRGKRVKYTFSDDEGEEDSDARGVRRSGRNTGVNTPNEAAGPTVTASGRQVRSRIGGTYGEIPHSGQQAEIDAVRAEERHSSAEAEGGVGANGRATRSGGRQSQANERASRGTRHDSIDGLEDESDAESTDNQWDGGDDDEEDDMPSTQHFGDDDEDADISGSSSDEAEEDNTGQSLLVKFKVTREKQEELMARNGETLRSSEPPFESITVESNTNRPSSHTPDTKDTTPLPASGDGATIGTSYDGTAEDKMVDVTHEQAQPMLTNGDTTHAPRPLANGASIPQLDGAGADETPFVPLSPDAKTKLPFSPKRESPPKLTSLERPVAPALSQAPSAAAHSFHATAAGGATGGFAGNGIRDAADADMPRKVEAMDDVQMT